MQLHYIEIKTNQFELKLPLPVGIKLSRVQSVVITLIIFILINNCRFY